MKTAEELAEEYIEQIYPKSNDDWVDDGWDEGWRDAMRNKSPDAFKAGFKAAQEWINAVNEEPPSCEPILCLAGSSNYPFVGEFNGKDTIFIRGSLPMEYDGLVYWRPIERR